MGYRAISAQRLLASNPSSIKAVFMYGALSPSEPAQSLDPIMVFSPSMFLPAVIARAEALAIFEFGSADILDVRRIANDLGILGVEADIAPIDGSPQGILRGLLISSASEQIFNLLSNPGDGANVVNLKRVIDYYQGEGARAVRGMGEDTLTVDPTKYEWRP